MKISHSEHKRVKDCHWAVRNPSKRIILQNP